MTNLRAEAFELVTFGAGGRFSRHDIDKTSALLEVGDVERYAQRIRTTEQSRPTTLHRRPGTVRR